MRLRFLKVLFNYHMKDRFCVTYLQLNAVEWVTGRIVAAGLDGANTVKITEKFKDWAFVGGRYDVLYRDMGDYNVAHDYRYIGNLLRLPNDVTDRL